MSQLSGRVTPTAPIWSHQNPIDQAFQEALSAFDYGSSGIGNCLGRRIDGRGGSAAVSGNSKPSNVKQVHGSIEAGTRPQHISTKSSRKDGTSLDNDDNGQRLPPDEGSYCLKPIFVNHGTFNLFDSLGLPYVSDNGRRPPYRYATLIGIAILSANNRRLTLAEIYQWISDNFTYYSLTKSGWQNSIRHNLSLNKNFVKMERSKHDPGKGHYWGIRHGQEHLFVPQETHRRRCTPAADTATGNLQFSHASTNHSSPTRPLDPSDTEPTVGDPGMRGKKCEDWLYYNAQSSSYATEFTELALEGNSQHEAFVKLPLAPSMSSQPPRKRGASPSSQRALPNGMATSMVLTADDDSVSNRKQSPHDCTAITHVDPAQLTLQAGARRSRFGTGRAETEIARIRNSHAKVPRSTEQKSTRDLPRRYHRFGV